MTTATDNEIPLLFMAFIAQDDIRLEHFMSLTGMGPGVLKQGLSDPDFQAMVLDYGLENESLILEFAAHQGLQPDAVLRARRKLPGASW
jgi:Protein of unknown function (DUF3572)